MKRYVWNLWLIGAFTAIAMQAEAQQITYSQPQRNDYKNTEFEIIGKVGGNILVYTSFRDNYTVSIYDNLMALKADVPLPFLPEGKVINVDFVAYPDRYIILYQFLRKRSVYCYGAILDAQSRLVGGLQFIDSTEIGSLVVRNKLYSVVASDDKSRIMVYKINQNKENTNVFYTFLLDDHLRLVNNSRVSLPMESKKDFLGNFVLDNNGDFILTKMESSTKSSLDNAWLVIKPALEDTLKVYGLNLEHKFLDDMKLKLDHLNKKVYIAAFYYEQRRSDVAGLYFGKFDWAGGNFDQQKFITFSDDLKQNAKDESTVKAAFDDYFIKQVVLTGDGGMLLTAESFYSSSANSPWDRWDYLYGPGTYYPSYYYSPFSPWYYSPYSARYDERYYYNNIAIFSYDPDGNLRWSNFINKNQYDDNSDALLSYQVMNTGDALHFIFNAPFRRSFILTDVSVEPDGKLAPLPTLRGLDQGYQWMPRFGKQVSSWQIVIPCIYRNYICFAKIDY